MIFMDLLNSQSQEKVLLENSLRERQKQQLQKILKTDQQHQSP